MGQTLIEKIIGRHTEQAVSPGQIVDVAIDVRAARDFGGANVVKNLQNAGLSVADPARTLFTFDCNPGGSDQGYAANQQFCRNYAREHGIGLRDITQGIGTHIAIEDGLVGPGTTFVSTDSHANILGAIGAFGQGMGDQDIAAAWASGKVWFKVPPTVKVTLRGRPGPEATAKDLTLALTRHFGARGLLGCAAELYGEVVNGLGVAERITIASMATEMGAIVALLTPNQAVLDYCAEAAGRSFEPIAADPDAVYVESVEVDIEGLTPLIARPGHPDDVVPVADMADERVDSIFIGSCTNGQLEDLRTAARILDGRQVADTVILKVVPSTRRVWQQALDQGIIADLMRAGALIGNAGCAGCADGQIGQNGPGEVTVSSGNRNFAGKQGKGAVYLASPATCAATAVAGAITTAENLRAGSAVLVGAQELVTAHDDIRTADTTTADAEISDAEAAAVLSTEAETASPRPTVLQGRVWIIANDDIDTDMIYHNRHLAVTDPAAMGRHAFGNLSGWEDFPERVQPGDIVVVGRNFGCGSSRQQAVDCFKSLGVAALIAPSYGAIYERNAINAGLPIVVANLVDVGLSNGAEVKVDLSSGEITWDGGQAQGEAFSQVQMDIYQRGGLLAR